MSDSVPEYFKYWGKADPNYSGEPKWHPLVYHCLDVAAVASVWWEKGDGLRRAFLRTADVEENCLKAWILFFIALHDLGKFDVRFQLKARDTALSLNPLFSESDLSQSRNFDHGRYGRYWFEKEFYDYGFSDIDDFYEWITAVCGHHGRGFGVANLCHPWADDAVIEYDRKARLQYVNELKKAILEPYGIYSINRLPRFPDLLAGFCSVCDWIGSNTNIHFFPYSAIVDVTLADYFHSRKINAELALQSSGMLNKASKVGGMKAIFSEYQARGVQQLVDLWPLEPGLTLVEAPTGSGKTEAALAYASKLLPAGLADSIVFALPTQATANAMLNRLEEVSGKIFPGGANVVLAHGKARFNSDFIKLQQAALGNTVQGSEEAFAQCAKWLATSRKRVFLGQIGVCTIDQILLSVLPIRHHFVRTFGIRKSVLIVDEIHAYDSYMNGLLALVLEAQQKAGGSAILLSATLPSRRRKEIFRTWGGPMTTWLETVDYPLVTHVSRKAETWGSPEASETRTIAISIKPTDEMIPSEKILDDMIRAAKEGELVVLICNLVADAQKIFRTFEQGNNRHVDLFHSRFRFCDRQQIEKDVLKQYGKKADRSHGRILVATQVVEQSLDLDFDWMLTQICPVDLLFQRLGRLHRHKRIRPSGFDKPRCIVLVPLCDSYGLHELIYADRRVLWRTHKLLGKEHFISFPQAYRDWIESVYAEDRWSDEPEEVTVSHDKFINDEEGKRFAALSLGNAEASPLADTDGNVSVLTRDSEMSLNVIPIVMRKGKRHFFDGTALDSYAEWEKDEILNMQTVPVPHSWRHSLPEDEEGLIFLQMASDSKGGWRGRYEDSTYFYHSKIGLERSKL